MVNAHLKLIGLKAGSLDGNRGQASFAFFGPGSPGDRIPNAKFDIRAYGMPGIPAALPAQVFFQGFHWLRLKWKITAEQVLKTLHGHTPPDSVSKGYHDRLIQSLGQYDKIPSPAGRDSAPDVVFGRLR
jgi:hypothetical protein